MFRRLLLLLSALSILTSLSAAADITTLVHNLDAAHNFDLSHEFEPTAANKTLNKYSPHFITTATISELRNALVQLTKLQIQAKKCVDYNTTELSDLDKRLTAITPAPNPGETKKLPLTSEQKFLYGKKDQLTNQLSDCRLFLLRSDDTITLLAGNLRTHVKTELLYQETTVLANLTEIPTDLEEFYHNFNLSLFLDQSGFYLFNKTQLIVLACLFLVGIIASIRIRNVLKHLIGAKTNTGFYAQLKQALLCIIQKYIIYFLPISLFALFITIITPSLKEPSYLACLSYAILAYLLFLMVIRFFFYPPKPAKGFSTLPDALAKSLVRRLKMLGALCILAYLSYLVFHPQSVPDHLGDLAQTVFISLVTINLIAIIWLVKKLPKMLYHFQILRSLISIFLSFLLVVILVAEWMGFHILAAWLLFGISITVFSAFIAKTIQKLVFVTFSDTEGQEGGWIPKFKRLLGLRSYDPLPELLWFRALLFVLIWLGFFVSLLKAWGLAQTNLQLLISTFLQGFQIANINIIPSRIFFAALLFILLSLTTRVLRNYVARRGAPVAQGNRESLASIVGYIGIAIALLISLLIAGVNFSGLAIIAGALSVGIGFGLQNIVNNFVSGLILLIERPIKPGDRIIVGDTEGYVRRISIRSTQIVTLQRADVIIPNSDLTSKQVTNYMLYDTNYKIIISVGVAYGSDLELVKKLLLEIANAHPSVINYIKDHEPSVYFTKFGDNSLEFQLWCMITDVNNRGTIITDINFAIDKAFREHNIDIAFPQREITVRNWPIPEKDLPK
ncbi:MAG TPA: mechanosensitive ion channel domain-containing protein [Gammaproteobacteria bacterium]|nr:mechanosensitive ion channel domain-containing protein [Gammaproteobacteria bacterium]